MLCVRVTVSRDSPIETNSGDRQLLTRNHLGFAKNGHRSAQHLLDNTAIAPAALSAGLMLAQSVPVVTGDAPVDKLLSQMTLQEKLRLIHGTQEDPKIYQGQAGYMGGISRLGIPGLRFADGPPGVLTRHPSQAEAATMAVAATFSVTDAESNGVVIGREARALGIDVSLQPFVNIDRASNLIAATTRLAKTPS